MPQARYFKMCLYQPQADVGTLAIHCQTAYRWRPGAYSNAPQPDPPVPEAVTFVSLPHAQVVNVRCAFVGDDEPDSIAASARFGHPDGPDDDPHSDDVRGDLSAGVREDRGALRE